MMSGASMRSGEYGIDNRIIHDEQMVFYLTDGPWYLSTKATVIVFFPLSAHACSLITRNYTL